MSLASYDEEEDEEKELKPKPKNSRPGSRQNHTNNEEEQYRKSLITEKRVGDELDRVVVTGYNLDIVWGEARKSGESRSEERDTVYRLRSRSTSQPRFTHKTALQALGRAREGALSRMSNAFTDCRHTTTI